MLGGGLDEEPEAPGGETGPQSAVATPLTGSDRTGGLTSRHRLVHSHSSQQGPSRLGLLLFLYGIRVPLIIIQMPQMPGGVLHSKVQPMRAEYLDNLDQ